MKKCVVIAMSGGVDSSVTAAILQSQGYECIGMHLHFWTDPETAPEIANLPQNKCCSLGGLEDARSVAEALGIPFYVMNVEEQFKSKVVDYFLEGYAAGRTPNPCVECNRNIKFGDLMRRAAELNADYLATGHYAKILKNADSGEHELHMAADKTKDQSYFLYMLTQEKLGKILFPLGDMEKIETYALAERFGLPKVCEKPESQGLCFFAEGNPKYFLQRYLPREALTPGPIVTADAREIGKHRGLSLYTIGQRHGLGIGGIAGEPEGEGWYVISMDREHNRLIVGREQDVLRQSFMCSNMSFVSGKAPDDNVTISVRIRYRGKLTPAVLEMKDGKGFVKALEPLKAIAPGQSAVFYDGEKILGGGIIEETHYEEAPLTRDRLSIAY